MFSMSIFACKWRAPENLMNDRDCKRIFALLSDYLDGDVQVKDCRELESHLKRCKPCLGLSRNPESHHLHSSAVRG